MAKKKITKQVKPKVTKKVTQQQTQKTQQQTQKQSVHVHLGKSTAAKKRVASRLPKPSNVPQSIVFNPVIQSAPAPTFDYARIASMVQPVQVSHNQTAHELEKIREQRISKLDKDEKNKITKYMVDKSLIKPVEIPSQNTGIPSQKSGKKQVQQGIQKFMTERRENPPISIPEKLLTQPVESPETPFELFTQLFQSPETPSELFTQPFESQQSPIRQSPVRRGRPANPPRSQEEIDRQRIALNARRRELYAIRKAASKRINEEGDGL